MSNSMLSAYTLTENLGSGSMGNVYLAHRSDGSFEKKVAIKFIRSDRVDKESTLRFISEQKILARLDHPYITRLVDAGYDNTRKSPYITMEFVEGGKDIVSYCRDKCLSIKDILKLFSQVLEAVSFAHRNFVIHRDLKPSNILVGSDGNVKVLDFGIAKSIDPDRNDNQTETKVNPFTPRYASPEQLTSGPLTTGSDIYSLGVVLYELLTNTLPFSDTKSDIKLANAIISKTPLEPSRAVEDGDDTTIFLVKGEKQNSKENTRQIKDRRKILKGDLDQIVLKSLRKEPERRYQSASEFKEDLDRYLSKRPVKARKDTILYLSTRFIQRNRVMVTLIAIFIFAVLGQQIRVMNERDNAIIKGEIANQVQEFMISLFEISDPGEARGNSITAREILDRGVEKIGKSLNEQPEEKSALMHTMGVVYRKLGLYDSSAPLLKDALELRQKFLPEGSIDEAKSLNEYGNLLWMQGQYEEAEKHLKQALAAYKNLFSNDNLDVSNIYNNLGIVYRFIGEHDRAIEFCNKALTIKKDILGENHPDVAYTYNALGVMYDIKGEYDSAIEYLNKALAIRINSQGENHPEVATIYNNQGVVYHNKGEYDHAIEYYEKALAIRVKTLGEKNPLVANIHYNLGLVYSIKSQHKRSIEYNEKALVMRIKMLGENHRDVAASYQNLGSVYIEIGKYDRAIEYTKKALTIIVDILGNNHLDVTYSYSNLGIIYSIKGEFDRAIEYIKKALFIRIEALGENHLYVANTYNNLGEVYLNKGKFVIAIKYLKKSISILSTTVANNHPLYAEVYANLGEIYKGLSENFRALDYYQKALAIGIEKLGVEHPDTIEVKTKIAKLKESMKL